jgi:hypothetical protein
MQPRSVRSVMHDALLQNVWEVGGSVRMCEQRMVYTCMESLFLIIESIRERTCTFLILKFFAPARPFLLELMERNSVTHTFDGFALYGFALGV